MSRRYDMSMSTRVRAMINIGKCLLVGWLIVVICAFIVGTIYTHSLIQQKGTELQIMQTRREDLLTEETSLRTLIVRFNTTLNQEVAKEAALSQLLSKSIEASDAVDAKRNQTTNRTIINTTIVPVSQPPPTVIDPPKPRPRTTRSS
jgi:hypothetical protein